ncbi:PBECR2 nuclease fold domain-containing protein [Aeromonas caviae]|uniref:PBECR2 nuclease fold domain-containing protein n=1 Tax=Aeromonas caviae TaxID=648 RepID=UPI0029DB6691|nr:PBECR2 nuclease fold domain-containing protein [Aeromonas caviae]MDX7786697.1 PBECR2 nuclease fold domain-containing protein [Aeromonas caviae]
MTVKECPGQPDWKSLELEDLKGLGVEKRLPAIEQEQPAATQEDAVAVLVNKFGFVGNEASVMMATPVGDIQVCRGSLPHIVEKRPHARERYVNHAIATLQSPFEVWEVAYDDGSYRYAFIGTFEERNMMLVVATITPDKILWNFMQSEAKSMNKHRHGKLVYARHK